MRTNEKEPGDECRALQRKVLLDRTLCMVGATGFEPATSCSRSRRATGLRYAPLYSLLPVYFADAPGGTRIPNLLIRSQMLYPIELRALTERRHIDLGEDDRMQTRIIDRAHAPVNPIRWCG